MKKVRLALLTAIAASALLFGGHYYLQHDGEMEVYSSHSMRATNYHEEYLTVVLNRLSVPDQMQCAGEIVQKCRENTFGNILFSHDYSIPNELRVSVYLLEEDVKKGKEVFSFSYIQKGKNLYDRSNIVDNPEKFEIILGEK